MTAHAPAAGRLPVRSACGDSNPQGGEAPVEPRRPSAQREDLRIRGADTRESPPLRHDRTRPCSGAPSRAQRLRGFEPYSAARLGHEHPGPDTIIPGMFANTCGMIVSGPGCSWPRRLHESMKKGSFSFRSKVSGDCTVDGNLAGKICREGPPRRASECISPDRPRVTVQSPPSGAWLLVPRPVNFPTTRVYSNAEQGDVPCL